jgi:uncharacterized protein (TIGR00661 family)
VETVPFLDTIYRDNKVDALQTALYALKVLRSRRQVIDRLTAVIEEFDPHLIVTDYEYFTPLAARKVGRSSISLDHQHVLTRCVYDRPRGQAFGRLTSNSVIRWLFTHANHFFIVSFFRLPPANPRDTEVFPPIIKRVVCSQKPSDGEHVLVYQTSETFQQLVNVLETIDKPFFIYGFGKQPSRRNLVFKERSEETFALDLATCSYVIANGGHNVISEALYLGKPVLSFPIVHHYEQCTNAYFVRKLGYGSCVLDGAFSPGLFETFHAHLDDYRAKIRSETFYGNATLVQRMEHFISSGRGSAAAASANSHSR